MKSFKMKALAVAVLGLAGAHAAFACPTAVHTTGNTVPGGGGAWTSQFIAADATLDIVAPGLNGTACTLAVSIGAASNSQSNVKDGSPNLEQRIRVSFYLNTAALTNFAVSNQALTIHRMNDATGPAQFTSDQLVVKLAGGATPTIRFAVSDLNPASGVTTFAVPLPSSATNTYHVEYDMQIGAGTSTSVPGLPALPAGCTAMLAPGNGCMRVWVSDVGAAITDTAPTASITVNNSGWGGAKTSIVGLQSGSPQYRAGHAGTVLQFDEYDSRRQTFMP